MARSRQRAKQRQAARRAERLGERTGKPAAGEGDGSRTREDEELREEIDLAAGAPPEDAGRTDTVLEHPPPHTDAGGEYAEEEFEETEQLEDELEAAGALDVDEREQRARRRLEREGEHPRHRERGKVLTFLANVWAELQRVQWPNRQQLTTLTGVVLGFVLIAGGYLGLLDAIFSRIIKAIL
jgi:preprotein translocase SecE subunit